MLQSDRMDFEAQVKMLFAGCDKPCTPERIEAYWLGLSKMGLPEVVRVIEHVLQVQGTKTTLPTPGQFWSVLREIKAQRHVQPVKSQESAAAYHGDKWDQFANLRLLRHITQQAGMRIAYCSDNARAMYPMAAQADQETVDITHQLITAKNGWASDMRDAAADGALKQDDGDRWWTEYMQAAERGVAYVRGQYAQQVAA